MKESSKEMEPMLDLMRQIAAYESMVFETKLLPTCDPAKRVTRKEQECLDINAAIDAIKADDLDALAKMVTTKRQANWHRPDQAWSLLDQAVRSYSDEIVEWLLFMGANPNTLFFNRRAVAMNKAKKPGMYFSPFSSAIHDGQIKIVKLLLGAGANLDLPVVIEDDLACTNCRDIAVEMDVWPVIEALQLQQSTPQASKSNGATRL